MAGQIGQVLTKRKNDVIILAHTHAKEVINVSRFLLLFLDALYGLEVKKNDDR